MCLLVFFDLGHNSSLDFVLFGVPHSEIIIKIYLLLLPATTGVAKTTKTEILRIERCRVGCFGPFSKT